MQVSYLHLKYIKLKAIVNHGTVVHFPLYQRRYAGFEEIKGLDFHCKGLDNLVLSHLNITHTFSDWDAVNYVQMFSWRRPD